MDITMQARQCIRELNKIKAATQAKRFLKIITDRSIQISNSVNNGKYNELDSFRPYLEGLYFCMKAINFNHTNEYEMFLKKLIKHKDYLEFQKL